MKKHLVANQEENTQATSLSIDHIEEIKNKTFIIIKGGRDINTGKKKEIVVLTKRLKETSVVKKVKVRVIHKSVKYIKGAIGTFSLKIRPDYGTIAKGPEDAYICMDCRCPCSLRIGTSCYDCNENYADFDMNEETRTPKETKYHYEEAVDIADEDLPF